MAPTKSIKDLDLETPVAGQGTAVVPTIDVEVVGKTAYPVTNSLQQLNQDFEGISSIAAFMPYFILDGTELLNKTSEQSYKEICVVINGGKPIWQLWDLENNLIAESFDGITTANGTSLSEETMKLKAKNPGQEEKIKVQARYDLYFGWDYEDGEKQTKLSLSPTSKYVFADYSKDLAKKGLGVAGVQTKITAKRTVSKQGYRFSVAQFELVGVCDEDR